MHQIYTINFNNKLLLIMPETAAIRNKSYPENAKLNGKRLINRNCTIKCYFYEIGCYRASDDLY